MFGGARGGAARAWLGAGVIAGAAWCPGAEAATWAVTNCGDSGPGSLRAAVAGAASGDTIDLRALRCTIELAGPVVVPQDELTLEGPGRFELTIDGNQAGRVFEHTGAWTLALRGLSVTGGYHAAEVAQGGCIHSVGTVALAGARVHRCVADSVRAEHLGNGGGVRALAVTLDRSSVFFNKALNGNGGGIAASWVTAYYSQVYGNTATGNGGGIYGLGEHRLTYSLVHGNRAARGGGIEGADDLLLNKSTLSNNTATTGPGGGFWLWNAPTATVVDSTISGNVAAFNSAGWSAYGARVRNSTIAFNRERPTDPSQACVAAFEPHYLWVDSSIIAGNTCDTGPGFDLGGWTAVLSGAKNLVGSAAIAVPPDTVSADPRLEPLADYGGPVRTHRPMADSPVIDQGANPFNRAYDQRGPGFPRVKGAAADIGAVER